MTDNPEARVDLVALEEYWAGAERGENDGQHMPKPPNADVAWEVATLCTKSIGHLLDFKKTGVLPDFNTPPSPNPSLRRVPSSMTSQSERASNELADSGAAALQGGAQGNRGGGQGRPPTQEGQGGSPSTPHQPKVGI